MVNVMRQIVSNTTDERYRMIQAPHKAHAMLLAAWEMEGRSRSVLEPVAELCVCERICE